MKYLILIIMLSMSCLSQARTCEIQSVGDKGLSVFSNGKRISDVWVGVPEFAYNSLTRLQNMGYCAPSVARTCEIQGVGDEGLAVFSNDIRISDVWDGFPEVTFNTLRRLQDMGYCAPIEAKTCEIQAVRGVGLAIFSNDKRISTVWDGVPEFAYNSLRELQDIGYCAPIKARTCEIQAVGDEGLAIFSNDKRISDVWVGAPQFAYNSLTKLQNMGYCAPVEARTCEIQAVGDLGLAIFSNGKRISDVWVDIPQLAYSSLKRLEDIGYCR